MNVSSCMWFLPKKRGYYSVVKTFDLKVMLTCMCLTILMEIWVWHSHYDARLTSHHISCELPYTLHMISDIHPPICFHCIPCVSSYLGDDVMMLPSRSVKALQEPSLMGIMRCDWIRLGFFPFVLGGHNWGINICNIISEMWHISILPFHP